MKENVIDFVITWVDGNDQDWIDKKDYYLGKVDSKKIDARNRRFRDWDNLHFLFRGIDKYASWVNHIYLVTPGQVPRWLNSDNPKITVINQDELFEDKSVTPTFNNCAIELLFHRIPGISEKFVYINDDMFFLRKTSSSDFFRNGLPCITIGFRPIGARYSKDGKGVYGIDVMNTRLVAKHFNKNDIIKRNWRKYFDIRNGKEMIKTILCLPFKGIVGFNEKHIAYSYLKSTYEEVWKEEGAELEESCKIRFRGEFSPNHHVMRYWQMSKGTVSVRNDNFSRSFDIKKIGDEIMPIRYIIKGKCKMICINDNIDDDKDFEAISRKIRKAFKKKFPEKCCYEI